MSNVSTSYRQVFEASLERTVGADSDLRFVQLFYDKFKDSHDEIAAVFANTKMERLFNMVKESLAEMTHFAKTFEGDDYMSAMARNHGQAGRKIRPGLYDVWLDCLIEAVREFDAKADSDVLLAWRVMLAPGIAYMKHYNAE